MDDFFHTDIRHLLLSLRLEAVRQEAAADRLAQMPRSPGRWRVLLAMLLVRAGTLLVAAGQALHGDPAFVTPVRRRGTLKPPCVPTGPHR